MSEVYKPVNGSTQIPVALTAGGNFKVAIAEGTIDTSSLAVESGGNLAAIKADVDKIPVKGSAAMAASTPVTLASDDTQMAALLARLPVPSKIASGTDLAATAYTSTSSYASCIGGAKAITRPYDKITVNVKEANVNAVMYQIIGYTESSGFTRPIVLATALDVAKNGMDYQPINMALLGIDIQAIDKVGGTHGSVVAEIVLS
jgi:hypothetical protein